LGYCAGYNRPGYAASGAGRGYGYGGRWGARGLAAGRGWGRGWGARFAPAWSDAVPPATPSTAADDEITALKSQADELRAALETIQNRLDSLEK
jgi:hypothetical protein